MQLHKKKLLMKALSFGLDQTQAFLTFQANNIVHYKVECEPSSVKKGAELGDEREVKLKGISGSESVFYNTVSGQHILLE